ncbi:MAG: hypothetical protein M3384_10555 [Acidobacteriota bacterium]|nr:hypothetical protein [Acidobacteriota bacterium]
MRDCQNKIKFGIRIGWFVVAFFLISNVSVSAQNNSIELNYNFHRGASGWTAGFADYPPGQEDFYELFAGIRYMPRKPTRVPRRGFMIQGNNHSDALFMFLKRRLNSQDGIVPNQTYRVEYVITFASNAPSSCAGTGGAPGEGVKLKAGASPIEPLPNVITPTGWVTMNVDLGDGEIGGVAASVAGNIANGIPCEQAMPHYPYVLVERVHQHRFNVAANSAGELWLLVGTHSGYESLTRLYYQSIKVKLTPISSLNVER